MSKHKFNIAEAKAHFSELVQKAMLGEEVIINLPSFETAHWRVFDYDDNLLAEITPQRKASLGYLPIGFYRLRSAEVTNSHWISVGVIAPLQSPTPLTSPIGLDAAMAWFYPPEKMEAAANLCALAGVNCRKVVLLDVCHAGQALEQNAVRRFLPGDHGPLVLAACDANEKSFEPAEVKHGLFTAALLEAVGPDRRAYKDGALTARGLSDYVKERVPELRRKLTGKTTSDQHPIEYLPKHADTVLMRTVRGGG